MLRDKVLHAWSKVGHNLAISLLNNLHDSSPNSLSFNSILYGAIIMAYPGRYTASNIADMLHVSRSAVAQKIVELEKDNIIYRVQSKADKRVFYLYPTDYLFEILRDSGFNIAEVLLEKYTEEEIEKYCEMSDFISDKFAWYDKNSRNSQRKQGG